MQITIVLDGATVPQQNSVGGICFACGEASFGIKTATFPQKNKKRFAGFVSDQVRVQVTSHS